MRSYYITPRRLTTTPFLWKSIGMMKIINKERIFEVPADTRSWLYSNWDKITPGNAVLCIEYTERHLEYQWANNPAASEKIMDVLINSVGHRRTALKNPYLREESLVNFIEGKLRESIAEDAATEAKRPSAWARLSTATVHQWTTSILRSTLLKTYQLEAIFKMYEDNYSKIEQISYIIADNVVHKVIPDYMFIRMLPLFYVENSQRRWNTSHVDALLLREAINRGMLSSSVPAKVTVLSQPKPTSFAPPLVPIVVPAPTKPSVFVSVDPVGMYLLPKAPTP